MSDMMTRSGEHSIGSPGVAGGIAPQTAAAGVEERAWSGSDNGADVLSTDGMLPHVAEFATVLSQYLASDSILLTGVRDKRFGVVDVVVVGRDATIGFVFGSASRSGMPAFADALYRARAVDVAYGLGDILYVAAREHASLFQPGARLRLVPLASPRILAARVRRGEFVTGQGEDGAPFVIRVATAHDAARFPGTERPMKRRAPRRRPGRESAKPA